MIKIFLTFVFILNGLFVDAQENGSNNIIIGQTTLEFYDVKRTRPITIDLWYPTSESLKESDKSFSPFRREFTVRDAKLPSKKLPLIMISHGTGGSRLSLEWLAQRLVKNGYLVAAPDHWGNTFDNPIAIEFVKPWERPLDMSFALTRLLEDIAFKAVIDEDKIGALGFSYGGYTVLALAGAVLDYELLLKFHNTPEGKKEINSIPEFPNLWAQLQSPQFIRMTQNIPNLKDDRFKAFFTISPGTARGFNDRKQFKDIQRPVFIIGAESDSITPVESYARKYHNLIHHSEYFEFKGKVGHYVMLAEASEELKEEAPIPFTDHPSVDRHTIHNKVSDLAILFFNKTLE